MRPDVVVRELQNSLMGAKEADYRTTHLAVRGIAKKFHRLYFYMPDVHHEVAGRTAS